MIRSVTASLNAKIFGIFNDTISLTRRSDNNNDKRFQNTLKNQLIVENDDF